MNDGPIAGGGMGAHDPSMDARVSRLEALTGAIMATLGRLEDGQRKLEDGQRKLEDGQHKLALEIAEMKGRVSQLPTTLMLLGFVIAVLAAGGFMKHFFP